MEGQTIDLWETASEPDFYAFNGWMVSQEVRIGPGLFTVDSAPIIGGLPEVGGRLTASPGLVSPASSVAYHYQWFSAATAGATPVAIPGATSSSYIPSPSMVHRLISVRVTESRTAFTSVSTFSSVTNPVLAAPSARLVHPPMPGHDSAAGTAASER